MFFDKFYLVSEFSFLLLYMSSFVFFNIKVESSVEEITYLDTRDLKKTL